jgi:type IV secretory pathway VirJ component
MKALLLNIMILVVTGLTVQAKDLPITVFKGNNPSKPILFYLTGDGGWNTFSTSLAKRLNKEGYSVVGLNSKSYFWSKKKPEQAAADIGRAMNQYLSNWKASSIIFIGYSFGADVAPFIQARLPKELLNKINHTILMSPSKNTDFEVHLLGMLGAASNNGESVPDEINKLTKPITIFIGSDEKDFPMAKLTGNNVEKIILAGGHHYDGNVDELAKQIVSRSK